MTLRERFTKDGTENPIATAALLLALYEYGDKGVQADDTVFINRVQSLCDLSDEQFEKEHARVMFELNPTSQNE